jgi:hypothetical protein
MAYVQLTSAQTDAESPLNQTLFDTIRGNFDFLTNGTNISTDLVLTASIKDANVTTAKIADANVNTAKLKTSTSETTVLPGTNTTLSITTEYSFGFLVKGSSTGAGAFIRSEDVWQAEAAVNTTVLTTSYAKRYYIQSSPGYTTYLKYRYITASPPYNLAGSPDWGLFVYVLRDKTTKEVSVINTSEDPKWSGDWLPYPKNHPARMAIAPHPFVDFVEGHKDWDTHEVVLLDLRHLRTVYKTSLISAHTSKMC